MNSPSSFLRVKAILPDAAFRRREEPEGTTLHESEVTASHSLGAFPTNVLTVPEGIARNADLEERVSPNASPGRAL